MVQHLGAVEPCNGRYHLVPGSDPILDRPTSKQRLKLKTQEDLPAWREMGIELVTGLRFNGFIALCILGNAVVIGLETDSPGLMCWAWIEDGFLTLFTLELALRLVSFGPAIFFDFHSLEFFWNMFDSAIVVSGLVEYAVSLFSTRSLGNGQIITFFRLLRISRLLRMFRLIRFLKEFNLLTFGFTAALAAIRYVAILMVVAIYLYAVLIVRIVFHWSHDSEHFEFLTSKFGTMARAMLSLFSLMSEPDLSSYRETMSSSTFMSLFLISFVVFISFGMIGLLTGLVCESMFDKNHLRLEEERLDCEAKRQRLVARCEELFESITDEDNDEASTEKVLQLLPRISSLFVEEEVSFAMHDLQETAGLMDVDGSGKISKTEFCRGILQIAEGLSPLSIMELHYVTSHAKLKIDKCEAVLLILLQGLGLDVADIDFSHPIFHSQAMRSSSKVHRVVSPKEDLKAFHASILEQLQDIRVQKAPAPEFRRMSSGASNSQKQVEQFWTQPVDGSTHERDDASRCLDELRELSKKILSELEPMRRQSIEAQVCADVKSLREASIQKQILSEIASLRMSNEKTLAEFVSLKDLGSRTQFMAGMSSSKDAAIITKRDDLLSQNNSSVFHQVSAALVPKPERLEMKECTRRMSPEKKLSASEGRQSEVGRGQNILTSELWRSSAEELQSDVGRAQNVLTSELRSSSAGHSWKDGDVSEATGRWRRALAELSD